MAEIWLFNSIAKRRRSAGDTFFENGLAALRGHLAGEGHQVKVIDWATERDYHEITPKALARINRAIAARLIALKKAGRTGLLFKLLFAISLLAQKLEDRVLAGRMERRLRGLAREVGARGLKVFGIKVWYGEAFEWSEKLCRYVREASPETVVIAGGHQPTLYEEEFLKRTSFDLAVVSQGELPMARLLRLADEMTAAGGFSRKAFVEGAIALAERGELRNVMYLAGGEVRRTERYERLNGGVHPPVYDLDPGKVGIHVVIESLGCTWGKCNFCVHQHLYDGYRPRGIESIVDEIERMRSLGVGLFRFAGSDTPPNLGRLIGEAILERGLSVEFGMGSRALSGITRPEVYRKAVEAYEVLIRAGLRAVFMGGETGHAWVNDAVMNKGLHPDEVAATAAALREAERNTGQHVDLSLALIYPTPTMGKVTHEEVFEADLDLVRRVGPDSVMVTPPAPFRNTVWNREARRFGFDLDENWVDSLIRYEYVLYKPPFLWEPLPFRFEGKEVSEVLELCGKMRNAIETQLGIPTDLSDEHFLMLRSAGFEGLEGARRFRELTTLDIVSGDYRNIRGIAAGVNARSAELAADRPPAKESGRARRETPDCAPCRAAPAS
jgi:radical SAM superfamily enzyme YgiQ (UPF0313 family)